MKLPPIPPGRVPESRHRKILASLATDPPPYVTSVRYWVDAETRDCAMRDDDSIVLDPVTGSLDGYIIDGEFVDARPRRATYALGRDGWQLEYGVVVPDAEDA